MSAKVAFQKNGWECGLYLLHFAQVFMGDPMNYVKVITTEESKSRTRSRDLWQVGRDFETKQRKEFRGMIEGLLESGLLKFEAQSEGVNDDDDEEVEIIETEPQAMDF